ncbi:MAG: endolytic transglycosylase MltG [Alphaproteobacteria bacterium]|nr:endolytic transglycosylase MltG [Alphaproteobacteria bacterium]
MFGKPKSRRTRNAVVDILNGFLSILVLAIIVLVGIVVWGISQFYAEGQSSQDTVFIVERGNGLSTVAQRLEDAGLISNRWIFIGGAMAEKKERALKHGEYKLTAGASMADILTELSEGTPITYSVTFPEGYTSWQIVERLNEAPLLEGNIETLPEEGTLLPDTYVYERGATRQSVLDRMIAAHDEALAEIWAERDPNLPLDTPEQLVILASIVEKETGVDGERPQVASVFVNRLKRNMRLQSDPTTIYGITKGVGTLGRGLRKSELEARTDYNTYQIDGLPAGPIANPGLAALQATANPDKTAYLYFVAAGATPSDGHLFATNYADHRKNVAQWRAVEREAAAEAANEAELTREALEQQEAEAADAGN